MKFICILEKERICFNCAKYQLHYIKIKDLDEYIPVCYGVCPERKNPHSPLTKACAEMEFENGK